MAERNVDEAYSIILDFLRSHNLSWVVTQVQDQVRAGKPVTKMVAPRATPMFSQFAEEVPESPRPRRERLAATEPYSSEERLGLVVDALERAVVHVADLESELVKFFQMQAGKDTLVKVAFEPEEFEETPRVVLGPFLNARREALERLKSVIREIRREARLRGNH